MGSIEQKKLRQLSPVFIGNLQSGLLRPLADLVKSDTTLCLQIRSNYINIYYRGGNLIRIAEQGNVYIPNFDEKYFADRTLKIPAPRILQSSVDVDAWIEGVPHLKQAMDLWFGQNPKDEREFQQLVWRENNGASIGNATDYFIMDIEYDNHNGARFDMAALRWDSRGPCRKDPGKFKPVLTLVEMKYGDGALTGSAGIVKHIEDVLRYVRKEGFAGIKQEMLGSFSQQRELGLVPALAHNCNSVETLDDQVDYLFILTNHDPDSDKLQRVLDEVEEKFGIENLGFTIKFCVSNFMGYGIYRDNVYSLKEFRERFGRQIACRS